MLSFFKKSPGGGLDHIVHRSVTMLGDARHSFDLATLALLTGADVDAVSDDIRETDARINRAEQELRSELVVHVTVKGATDIGTVLGLILLLKKIERIGDQAKNILDLAEGGVLLSNQPDTEAMLAQRSTVSALFAEAAEMLASAEEVPTDDYVARANTIVADTQAKIDEFMRSDRPGHEVVPAPSTTDTSSESWPT
ncbi:MAG: PhoU domain-containing protein [Acidimicrobiales bacterium]